MKQRPHVQSDFMIGYPTKRQINRLAIAAYVVLAALVLVINLCFPEAQGEPVVAMTREDAHWMAKDLRDRGMLDDSTKLTQPVKQ